MHSDHPGGDTFRSLSIAPESVICAATWIAETPTVVAARPPTDSSRERAAKPTSRASRAQTHAPSSARRVSRVRETSCVLPGWSRRPRSGCSQLNGEAEARPPQPARLLAAGCRARSVRGRTTPSTRSSREKIPPPPLRGSSQPQPLLQPWRTSSRMTYESSSPASDVGPAPLGLRIIRRCSRPPRAARQPSAWRTSSRSRPSAEWERRFGQRVRRRAPHGLR